MDRSKKIAQPSPPTKQPTTTSTPSTVPIDYRTLVKRSRYDQIETELSKLKSRLAVLEEQNNSNSTGPKTSTRSIGTETNVTNAVNLKEDAANFENSGNRRLSQSLVNIEDDLHRILFILLHQYEMLNSAGGGQQRHTKPKALMIQAQESKTAKHNEHRRELSSNLSNYKLRRERTRAQFQSQPNLSNVSEEDSSMPQSQSPKNNNNDENKLSQTRSSSGERRKSLSPTKSDYRLHNSHFHLTKPDVHWILGTSPNPSFSMMARKQMKLALLKQHGPLCFKSYITPAVEYTDAPEERARIIHRIQSMINDLQLEYDRVYRQLQFRQTFADNQEEEEAIEIPRISNHLIHIMDQLVDLHQLNKSFLC